MHYIDLSGKRIGKLLVIRIDNSKRARMEVIIGSVNMIMKNLINNMVRNVKKASMSKADFFNDI